MGVHVKLWSVPVASGRGKADHMERKGEPHPAPDEEAAEH